MIIDDIRKCLGARNYRLSLHGEEEMRNDNILEQELIGASIAGEILE